MRKIRQDERDLIDQWVKEGRVKKVTLLESIPIYSPPPLDSIPEPWSIPGRTVNCRSTLVPVEKIKFRKVLPNPSQCVPVPPGDLPQEETLDQIKRMIDALPENHFCEQTEGECEILMNLMISEWAREYLKQLVRDQEKRHQ